MFPGRLPPQESSLIDFAYHFANTLAIEVQYRCCAYPLGLTIESWASNKRSIIHLSKHFSDYRIDGYVLSNTTGKPVPGAYVILVRSRYTITDKEGRYSLLVAPGEYVLYAHTSDGSFSNPFPMVRFWNRTIVDLNITLNGYNKDTGFQLPTYWDPDASVYGGDGLPSGGMSNAEQIGPLLLLPLRTFGPLIKVFWY